MNVRLFVRASAGLPAAGMETRPSDYESSIREEREMFAWVTSPQQSWNRAGRLENETTERKKGGRVQENREWRRGERWEVGVAGRKRGGWGVRRFLGGGSAGGVEGGMGALSQQPLPTVASLVLHAAHSPPAAARCCLTVSPAGSPMASCLQSYPALIHSPLTYFHWQPRLEIKFHETCSYRKSNANGTRISGINSSKL